MSRLALACIVGIKGHGVTTLPSMLAAWCSRALSRSQPPLDTMEEEPTSNSSLSAPPLLVQPLSALVPLSSLDLSWSQSMSLVDLAPPLDLELHPRLVESSPPPWLVEMPQLVLMLVGSPPMLVRAPPMVVGPPPMMLWSSAAAGSPPPPPSPSATPCAMFSTQVQFFNLVLKFGKLGQLKLGCLVMNCYVDMLLVILSKV
jgi:hypothetical protein